MISFFREKIGSTKEARLMFGSLYDGMDDLTRWRRIFYSQQDFAKKVCI